MTIEYTKSDVTEAIATRDVELAVRILNSSLARSLDERSLSTLSYVRFNSLSIAAALKLVGRTILAGYDIDGFSIKAAVQDYLDQYNYPPDEIQFSRSLLEVLMKHNEQIGQNPIEVSGQRVPPTIGAFLSDFNDTTQLSPLENDALSILQYINNSPNVKLLTIPNRTIIKDIIELYGYLNRTVAMWDLVPSDFGPDALPKGVDHTDLNLGLLGIDREWLGSQDEAAANTQSSTTPAVAVAQPHATEATPAITKTKQLSQRAVSPAEQVSPAHLSGIAPKFQIPLNKDLNLSTKERSGLVFDQPTNVDLQAEQQQRTDAAAAETKKAADIQAKLEALKQRKDGDSQSN